ncbi:hypothetical protein GCM10027416_16700 [Okibacterium endophyticum]
MTGPTPFTSRGAKATGVSVFLALVTTMVMPLAATADDGQLPVPSSAQTPPAAPAPDQRPVIPQPEKQSDQPAPLSADKRIIGPVHTDAVSAYLDAGTLVLESKADIDVTGDGITDLGTRLKAKELLFHLSDAGKITVPDLPAYSFLGEPGSTLWMAPQTQNHNVIWPGFSTEDPNLSGKVTGNTLDVRLIGTEGPGNAEVYMQNGAQVQRVFSSTTALPAWTIGVPQHTHMNWAFSRAGTYTFTFEMSAVVDGREQTAINDYTFVVGDLDSHTRTTTTTLSSSAKEAAAGDPILFTAELDPPETTGAVQFRDLTSDTVLGHTPIADGAASFRADALTPGQHQVVAEFVPTWSNDYVPSTSRPVTITVSGEVRQKPVHNDTIPVPGTALNAHAPGTAVVITSPGKKTTPGGTITVALADASLAGHWVSAWLPGQASAWRGWIQADLTGRFSLGLPDVIATGTHQLVVKDDRGALIGWDRFTVSSPSAGGGGDPSPPPQPAPPTPAPVPAPRAPGQQCAPGITLETGHIDAFYVSAANGKAVLQLMEDVTGHRVIREAETVLLRVKESAYRSDIPEGTPGAPAGYVLPLTQDPALIWPGWDTNRTAASGHTDVSINITGVEGPGRVHVSSQGSFGDITSLLQGGGHTLPGTLREATPAHTHAQWVFTQKGIYTLTVHAVATNPANGQTLTTASHTYVFQVGDVPLGDTFCGLSSTGAGDAAEVNTAVNRAAADAVAAARAAATTEAEAAAPEKANSKRSHSSKTDEADDPFEQIFGDDADPAVVAGIVTGGVLVILGIAGATYWYLRRLRTHPTSAVSTDPGA